jgi:hypothetical protein
MNTTKEVERFSLWLSKPKEKFTTEVDIVKFFEKVMSHTYYEDFAILLASTINKSDDPNKLMDRVILEFTRGTEL